MGGRTSPLKRQLRSLLHRPLATCLDADPIVAAARTMTEQGVTSVVVLGSDGRPQGIVTDRDLRARVIAAGLTAEAPVASIMTAPLVSVSPETFVHEALLEMTRHGVHHLLVVEAGRLLGVLTSDDLVALQAATPLEVIRAIEACASLDEMAPRVPELTRVTRGLFEEGLSGYELGRLVAEMNDALIRRVLALVERDLEAEGLGRPPLPFCWLVLGSEGRREQTIHTDQDNALVYEDPPAGFAKPAAQYFGAFAERVIDGLLRLGYPRCPGESMASNPRWRQPLAVWRDYVADWARDTTPEHLMEASISLDFRFLAGEARLAEVLREEVRAQARAWRSFPRYLAKIAVSHGPPLGLFGRFVLRDKNGARGVDVKLGGMLLLTNALRVYAIDLGLAETNTIERLEAATRIGNCFRPDERDDLRQTYETIFHLRLRHQLARVAAGARPDNLVDPRALSPADRRGLKDAFRSVRRLQGKLKDRYFTEAI
jgi:CBS domain-containing protein